MCCMPGCPVDLGREQRNAPLPETNCFWLNLQIQSALSSLWAEKTNKQMTGNPSIVKALQKEIREAANMIPSRASLEASRSLSLPASAITALHSQLSRGHAQGDGMNRTNEHQVPDHTDE